MGRCNVLGVDATFEMRDGAPYCTACGGEIPIYRLNEQGEKVAISLRDWNAEQDALEAGTAAPPVVDGQ